MVVLVPARFARIIFQKPSYGSDWCLATVRPLRTANEGGSAQRITIDWPHDAQASRTATSILLRLRARSETPADRITGNPSAIVAGHRLLAEVSEYNLPLRVACARLLFGWRSLTRTLQFLSGAKSCGYAGSRSPFLPRIGQPGAIRIYARRKRSRPSLD